MKQYRRSLRHARYGIPRKMAKLCGFPGVEVSRGKSSSSWSSVDFIKEKLSIGLDRVNTCRDQETVEVVVESRHIFCVDYKHLTSNHTGCLCDFEGFVLIGDCPVR